MIGAVYRGRRAGGLVRYLYGPGRHNEHVNPRIVAGWSASDESSRRALEPEMFASGGRDFSGLIAELEAPMLFAERLERKPIWHVALRTAAGDRQLSDGEWAEVAADVIHRTGIAPRGDDSGCRWVAVNHCTGQGDDHIHIVAVLARQDGLRAHPVNDYRRVREACLAAEQRYGLTSTAPADATAARHTSRPEVEKAKRVGLPPARDWLREQVQHAAVGSRDPAEFFDRLRAGGVMVREHTDAAGQVNGYAVGRREPGRTDVFFGGGKLAADLSLPKLQARWVAAGGPPPAEQAGAEVLGPTAADDPGPKAVGDADRREVWDQAIRAASTAADEVRQLADTDPASAGDAAAAAAEVLAAAGRLIEGDRQGPLTIAARDYDRAARERHARLPESTATGMALRMAALQLARTGRGPRKSEAAKVALLVAQMARLVASVQQLRAMQQRQAQGEAAGRAKVHLNTASAVWIDVAQQIQVQRPQTASTQLGGPVQSYGPSHRPPPGPAMPPPSSGRSR